ncbi:tRNA (guanosine(46)-N7)-methyltransferase TrmB [Magnetospira sp. QH-2]|uniref:tRNA (guanosine(46)-N7)-methyltransferase TrmB n=1 Tax=Magnetospira sp. (strain QH-2) TaxID=1288970 RepID=UPI0003E80B0E|nr:tRNA (guanosine(46)-N7)-methyltransferase TrmB [Magnetospira sp. QH-2]CCQ75715.1 tRNA (guanine-N(7)-)-methyltransferase [Magnetospira sp. QH-2]
MTPDDLNRDPARRLYGRRQGKPLRTNRQKLVEELLPALRLDLDGPLDPASLFERPFGELWLELGFGGGEHLAAQAAARRDVGFIGCEPFINGVARLLTEIRDRDLDNIRLLDDDARKVFDRLPDASLDRVFVLFPDPWPKSRHAKRRFICPPNLDLLARVMKPGAELRVASDHMTYIRWALRHLMDHPKFQWTARRAEDWRHRPADAEITRYESKALAKGDRCVYLTFVRTE